MRIGEVLKLILRDPKSGKEQEFVFIPQKAVEKLKEYVKEHCTDPDQKNFTICYEADRAIVKKAGNSVGGQVEAA